MKGVFVTGTDTGVGKTLVSTALVLGYGRQGQRVAGVKPVVSGVTEKGVWEDVEALRAASTPPRAIAECTLHAFDPAIAPHWAAREAGRSLDLEALVRFVREQAQTVDRVVVEGAGGFLVPLGDGLGFGDLAQALALPVVLVVGLRLGAINHALLTYEAIARRGLVVEGWVGSALGSDVPPGTVEGLHEYLPAPCLGIVPFHTPVDPFFAGRHIRLP